MDIFHVICCILIVLFIFAAFAVWTYFLKTARTWAERNKQVTTLIFMLLAAAYIIADTIF